jgi:hypothetical protein
MFGLRTRDVHGEETPGIREDTFEQAFFDSKLSALVAKPNNSRVFVLVQTSSSVVSSDLYRSS